MAAKWQGLGPVLLRIIQGRGLRIAAAVLLLYALLGFLVLPSAVEHLIPKYARETLQRQASIGAVRINPFLFKVEAEDFRVQEMDGQPIAAFRHLLVDFELSSLFRRAWTFADIRLEGLDLLVDKDPDNRLNLVALAESFPKGAEPAKPEGNGLAPLLLRHIALVDGVISYNDRSGKEPAKYRLRPINFEINNVATLPKRQGAYALIAELPEGGSVDLRGETTLQPFVTTGALTIQGFRPATIWKFLHETIRLADPQGVVDLQTGYRLALDTNRPQLELQGLGLHVEGLDIREPAAQSPLLALATLEVKDGRFDLDKRSLILPQIALHKGSLGATLAEDGSVNWQKLRVPAGEQPTKAEPAGTDSAAPWHIELGAVQLDDIAVNLLDRSRPAPLTLDIGRFGLSFKADIQIGADATAVGVQDIALQLEKIALRPLGDTEPLITLGELKVNDGSVDTRARSIHIGQVSLGEAAMRIDRDKLGNTRLFKAFRPADHGGGTEAKATPADMQPPWRFVLEALHLNDCRVGFSDQGLQPALAYDLEGITATLKNVSNDGQTPVNFEAALRVVQGGALSGSGSFAPDGSTGKMSLKLEKIALPPLRPLLAEHAALDLKAGTASALTEVSYASGKGEPLLRATGTASIADLLINEATTGERFIAWKNLTIDGIGYQSAPGKLSIKEIRLNSPSAKVQIFKDRSVNLGKVFEKPSPTGAPAQPAPAVDKPEASKNNFPVTVGRVRIENGLVDYSDQSLILPFAAKIQEFHGTVIGIASDPASRAQLDFEGRVEQYGSARISGSLMPFAPKQFTDIRTQFSNIDMPPFTPYSATFAGRKIASGKLSLDLEYKINNSALAGDNKILLDKFTLGEPIDSPSALDLPLDLAIALLTDSQGRIDIAVPVSGDMDNPEFSLGGVIGQAIVRILTKIVTAPFRALGNLLGLGGEESSAIAFMPGSARLSPPQLEKLVNVVKSLGERPQLKVVVGGSYDPKLDGAALRSERVRRDLARELDVKLSPGEDPGQVAYDDAQSQRALEKLLAALAGDKAVDVFQAEFEKQAGHAAKRVNPVLALMGQASPDHAFYEALFAHLVEIQPLAEADLQALAQQRAEVITQAFVSKAGVDPQRLGMGRIETVEGNNDNMVETVLSLDVQGAGK